MSGVGTPQYPPSRDSVAGSRASGSVQGSRASPTQGSMHGSRSSLNRGSVSGDAAPLDLDPELINPADTVPAGGPRDVPPQTPDDLAEFTLPGYEDPKAKKKQGKGGLSDKFKGGFGRMKALFKKGPTETPSLSGIEDDDDYVTGSQEYLDKVETPGASGGGAEKQTTMQKFQNLFKKSPEMASPSLYQPGDIMILKEPEPKTMFTFGNFINVMLIVFMVAGIIMCACIGVEESLYYLGPAFLGLAFFALVGKIFFTCFWKEDPIPKKLKPIAAKYESLIGGVKNPYAHKMYTQRKHIATYYGPMSTVYSTEVVQMETFSYPMAPQPKMYDESIDTRLRQASPAPSSNRSFVQDQPNPLPASLDYSDDLDRYRPPPSYT